MTWARRWKAPIILGLLLLVVISANVALESLHPIAQRIERALLHEAEVAPLAASIAATIAYDVWISTKALVLPAIIIALTLFVEARLSEAEREPKDYVAAAIVQVSFFYVAHLGVRLVARVVPVPGTPLLDFSARSSGAASTILTIASIAVFLILFDVLLYWTHRAHHHVPFLWRFHAVHHSPRDLDALHNYVHPVEQLVRYFSVGLPLSFIVQIDEQQFYLVFTLLAVQNQLSHMNVPLNFGIFGNVLVDNRHHFIHHSSDPKHFNRNYAGIFSFTDRLFRTFEPAGVTLPTTGFSNNDIPRTLWEFILARKAAVASTRRRSRPLSQPVL